MPVPIKLSPEDRVALKRFYDEIDAIDALPGSGNFTVSALEHAGEALRDAAEPARQMAWQDVYEALKSKLDTDYKKKLEKEAPGPFRPENRYLQVTQLAIAEQSRLRSPIKADALQNARKDALKSAIEHEVDAGEGEQIRARKDLLRLIEGCRSADDIAFLREGWGYTVTAKDKKYVALPTVVAALERGLSTFQALHCDESDIETALEAVKRCSPENVGPATICGKPVADVAREVEDLIANNGARRLILDENKMRVDAYGRTVERILEDPLVKKLMPTFERLMAEDEERSKKLQSLRFGTPITKDHLDRADDWQYGRSVYALVQEVSRKLGFSADVEVVIASHLMPNAYVFTADMEHPRVTFFTPMIEKFWDFDTHEWVKVWVSKDGKRVLDDSIGTITSGATQVPVGKRLVESVIAHELGHIRDRIVLVETIAIYLFLVYDRDVLGRASGVENAEKRAQLRALIKQAMAAAQSPAPVGACDISLEARAAAISDEEVEEALLRAEAVASEVSPTDAKRVLDMICESTDVPRTAVPVAADGPQADLTFGDIFRFIKALLRMSRVAEETADRYGVIEQATAKWSALMEKIFVRDLGPNPTTADKKRVLRDLMRQSPEVFSSDILDDVASATTAKRTKFGSELTHPFSPERIAQEFLFEREGAGFAAELREFGRLTPDEKLLVTVQLYEKKCIKLDTEIREFKPQQGYALHDELTRKGRLVKELEKLEKSMKPYMDLVDTYVGERGLVEKSNAFVEHAVKFISDKGVDLADKKPFRRLAKLWHDRLSAALKTDTLSKLERDIAEERREKLRSTVEGMKDYSARNEDDDPIADEDHWLDEQAWKVG